MTKIGLALGGGAARGIAHIAMLEVFDELGLKPSVIAGCSMGALVGAAYASGLDAKTIRNHAEDVLGNRVKAARKLFQQSKGNPLDLINLRLFSSIQIDGPTLTELVLPTGVAEHVEDTSIPFKIATTDFFGAEELVITKGPMAEAVAASIALPGLISGPPIGGRVVIDGAITNPVPLEHVREGMDLTVAIDVTGSPLPRDNKPASNTELAVGAFQIMQRKIAALKRAHQPPDIYIEPDLGELRAHEFFKVHEFLEAARPTKEQLKRELDLRFSSTS